MDIITIGLSGNEEVEITSAEATVPPGQELGGKDFSERDALSALKLDPAVMEAQLTIGAAPDGSHHGPLGPNQKETDKETPTPNLSFAESLTFMQQNAQLNLTSEQCALLMMYADNLKKQPVFVQLHGECVFCRNNGEPATWYTNHTLKDRKGRVRCPVLRAIKCPICGNSGNRAHTVKYCPNNKYTK